MSRIKRTTNLGKRNGYVRFSGRMKNLGMLEICNNAIKRLTKERSGFASPLQALVSEFFDLSVVLVLQQEEIQ